MKLPEMPASIVTQLKMYDSTIADAEAKLAAAEDARRTMLDEFYGLLGKLIRVTRKHLGAGVRSKHFRVEYVEYGAFGTVDKIAGPAIRADGSVSNLRTTMYAWELRDSASWRIVDSVDA